MEGDFPAWLVARKSESPKRGFGVSVKHTFFINFAFVVMSFEPPTTMSIGISLLVSINWNIIKDDHI